MGRPRTLRDVSEEYWRSIDNVRAGGLGFGNIADIPLEVIRRELSAGRGPAPPAKSSVLIQQVMASSGEHALGRTKDGRTLIVRLERFVLGAVERDFDTDRVIFSPAAWRKFTDMELQIVRDLLVVADHMRFKKGMEICLAEG